jgi:hypothetical protein
VSLSSVRAGSVVVGTRIGGLVSLEAAARVAAAVEGSPASDLQAGLAARLFAAGLGACEVSTPPAVEAGGPEEATPGAAEGAAEGVAEGAAGVSGSDGEEAKGGDDGDDDDDGNTVAEAALAAVRAETGACAYGVLKCLPTERDRRTTLRRVLSLMVLRSSLISHAGCGVDVLRKVRSVAAEAAAAEDALAWARDAAESHRREVRHPFRASVSTTTT